MEQRLHRRRSEVAVRTITKWDAQPVEVFLSGIVDGERRFLKEDLDDAAVAFARFVHDSSARRLLAVTADGEVVGMAGVFPGEGWSSHVAELRPLVSAPHRGGGIGSQLARSALIEALQLGCTRVYVEVVAEQDALVSM